MPTLIFVSWVTAFDQADDDKTLNLKIGFDLTRGENGAPSIRIRNFEAIPEFDGRKFNARRRKEALRTQVSSESDADESVHEKIASEIKEARESDRSDDDTSGDSDEGRRLSTKGISPDEFEPQRNHNVHVRIDRERIDENGSDSE